MRRLVHSRNRVSSDAPYTPIDSAQLEIRLAVLSPGNYHDAVVVNLRVGSLATSRRPKYEALSYAWGKNMCPNRATVNGTAVSISENLDSALRHLRYQDKHRTLWIDALCINQSNVAERNSQVQMMTQIYSTALRVLIWLGPADDEDEVILRYMTGELSMKFWDMQNHLALTRICQRAWFSRVWIIQELVVAESDPLVHLGRREITWDRFSMFIRHVSDGNMSKYFDSVAPQGSDLHWKFWNAAKRIISLQILRSDQNFDTFADRLAGTAEFLATDPRDKVYGILAMDGLSNSTIELKADYAKSVREVFIETVFYLIQEDPCTLYRHLPLHPLMECHTLQQATIAELPSWAMDITLTSQETPSNHFYNRPVGLVPNYIWGWTSDVREKKLGSIARMLQDKSISTVGTFIGTVAATSRNLLFNNHEQLRVPGAVPIPATILHQIHKVLMEPKTISPERLLRALKAGTETFWDIQKGLSEAYTQLATSPTEPDASSEAASFRAEALRQITATAQNLILFVTNEGHVGTTYHPDAFNGIRAGDVVVGLFGVCLPFVLRRSERGKYHMINVAFVEGHYCDHPKLRAAPMGTTEDDVWNDLEGFDLQEYTIV